jgi:hypothetical protein
LDGSTFQEYYFDVTPMEWAGDVTLPIDIRLSSWVNKTVHFHNVINGITEDPIDTGAGLISGALVDANGNVWSYNQTLLGYCPAAHIAPYTCGYTGGSASGWQGAAFTHGPFDSGNNLDPAGLNAHAIEMGRANIQFWGWNDTWGGENYGIPSGTYTPHVFALGYIELSPELVSVTLSGNPTSVSDHVYRGAGFNVTVYSIDWERPTVSRDWVWGQWGIGPGIAVPVGNSISGQCGAVNTTPWSTADNCDPWGESYTMTGKGTAPPLSPGYGLPSTWASMVGQEIDLGFYHNGTLVTFLGEDGDITDFGIADTTPTSCLFQNDTTTYVEMCGGGWNPYYLQPATETYTATQGNSNDAFFGSELIRIGYVGGYTGGVWTWITAANKLFAPAQWSPTPVPGVAGADYFTGITNLYPVALPGGIQYDLRAYTYGYIQDQPVSAYASSGQVADMDVNLVIGVNVTLSILFKKEHIITPTGQNMSARVRLFDDTGRLVGEWMSSEGTYVTASGFARAADGTTQYPFANLGEPMPGASYPTAGGAGGAIPFPLLLNTYNYLPGGTTELTVLMAGLPVVPASGENAGPSGSYENKETYFMDGVLAPGCDFGIACYANPGTSWNAPGYFPNYGILGASDYQGGWTAEVDFVNWYANNTGTPEILSDGGAGGANIQCGSGPFGPSICTGAVSVDTYPNPASIVAYGQYYEPVVGLLMGESYHVIPGTTAASGVSLTEDVATGTGGGTGWPAAGWSVGHSMAPNHLGPYSQEGVWQISGAHNSGEASAIFEVDLNGFVSGTALAFAWNGQFRTLSWGTVSVAGAAGTTVAGTPWNFYTSDGIYQAYLPPGSYQFTITSPGLTSQSWAVAVSPGMNAQGQNLYLLQSNIPVPEFSGIAIAAVSALAASLYILRRRRK